MERHSSLSRRQFVVGAGAAGVGLLTGCTEVTLPTMPPRRPAVVALLMADAPPPSVTLELFRQGLAEQGWALGHNLVLAERSGEGQYERLPELATDLLTLPPDVLLTVGTQATVAARNATATVPIVFATGSNPVAVRLADSYQRPGENVTGITSLSAELSAKRLELLTEIVPGVSRVAVFWREPAALPETQSAAQALGVRLYPVGLFSDEALWPGLDAAIAWGAEALLFEPQPMSKATMSEVAAYAIAHRLPAMSGNDGFPRLGGLTAYTPRIHDIFRRAAAYVDKILKGAKPADLPIEQPMTFDFVVNLKTAQALGVTFPNKHLLLVTEVIQ